VQARNAWRKRIIDVTLEGDGEMPAAKKFKAKHNLPALDSYRDAAPASFWEKFPKNYSTGGKSMIRGGKLKEIALAVGCWTPADEIILADLTEGANIGCTGRFREGSCSKNAESAFLYPREITDAIASWVTKGFAKGPFDQPETGAKINGIMCKPKPNGSPRIILYLSAPEGRSVNDGIVAEDFPATMSSTTKWLEVLEKAGTGALMLKADWADAYKHIGVRIQDIKLQWFSWLGKFFAELCLVFGTASSVGIFDRVAKLVLRIVLRYSLFPGDYVCQHLDDLCAASSKEEGASLFRLEKIYRMVAESVGVVLCGTDDPEKAFSPCTRGLVLGVLYDTVNWTWEIPAEKVTRLSHQIRAVLEADTATQGEIWSLAGRIMHYAPLIPAGRMNLSHIMLANAESVDRKHTVHITAALKRQLWFWLTMVKASSGYCRIPAPSFPLPAWAVDFFTDSAGGSLDGSARGAGGVCGRWWFQIPWGNKINGGALATDGKKLGRKMSALELVGPLACLAAALPLCRGRPVKIWVDNSGSVHIWRKGYATTCQLSSCLVRAIACIADAVNCRVDLVDVRRCSSTGPILADDLSKGLFGRFKANAAAADWELNNLPATIPRTLLHWVANPVVDDELGQRILKELALTKPILNVNC
jgi:hypothetical protein